MKQVTAAHGNLPTSTQKKPATSMLTLLWLACGSLAFLLSLYSFSATLVDGVFFPADHDSFYHARRIIAALNHPLAVMQFDPNIHAPEGSWVTWPWAYDTMMAVLGGWLMALTGLVQPMAVLAFIAPAWVYINAALLIAVGRRLGLDLSLLALALLVFAVSPLTRELHRVGMLDHHFVELSFVLTVLWLGLRWFADLEQTHAARWCAVLLGAAPAFHNGLFILQLPILITMFVIWASGRNLSRRSARTFGMTLIASSSIFLLPSEPFRDGQFFFYLHSWFHLYIAIVSALVVLALAYLPRRALSLGLIGAGAAVLALPIIGQVSVGGSFLSGGIVKFDVLFETQNLLRAIMDGEYHAQSKRYSDLLWLLPVTLAVLVWQLRSYRNNRDLFFLIMCVFGSALMTMQFRLQYFGSFALYLSCCVIAQRWVNAHPGHARKIGTITLLIFALAHIAPLRALDESVPLGGSFDYMVTRNVYPVLDKVCATSPGVILADHNDGHYITYHSDCPVIANNFILTPQHERKVIQSDALLRANLDEVMKLAPYVRYIFVRREDNILASEACHPGCVENAGLRDELLGESALHSPHLRLLFEALIKRGDVQEPLARLFAVVPSQSQPLGQPLGQPSR